MVFNFSISSGDDGETPALTPVASPQQSLACSCCAGVISRFDEQQLQDRSRDRGAVGRMQDENPMGSNDSAGKVYGKADRHLHRRRRSPLPLFATTAIAMSTHDSEHGHIIEVCEDVPAMEMSQMSTCDSEHGHIIEVCGDVVGSKVCAEAPCGFSDARNSSKDARERSTSMKKLLIAVVLCIIFMSVEVVGGIEANSLAILTDAAHLLSDVAAFAISLFSIWASGWEATPRQSYGFFRIEILGALVSIQIIWLLAGILMYEAIERLINGTTEVHGFLMFIIAAFGLLVNIVMALFLGHDHSHGHGHSHEHETVQTEPLLQTCSEAEDDSKLGIKQKQQRNISAYLHVLGDSIQSVGVMICGAIIWIKPEWKIVDLICTLIFSVIEVGTTIRMLRSILEVLMESTPREIDATRLESGLREMDEVIAVHELHIWAMTVGKVLLACHVKIKRDANADMVLEKAVDYIRREYKISHVTVQVERE